MSLLIMSLTYDLHSALGYQLSLTARHVERRFETELQHLGLSRITWCVALAVGGHALGHPSDIAKFVGLERSAVSRALRRLQRDGLITRARGKSDARTRLVRLTPAGETVLEQANALARSARRHSESCLSEVERQQLRTILEKLQSLDEYPLGKL